MPARSQGEGRAQARARIWGWGSGIRNNGGKGGVDPILHLESHWSLPSCARALPASKDLGDTPPISDLRRISDFNKLRHHRDAGDLGPGGLNPGEVIGDKDDTGQEAMLSDPWGFCSTPTTLPTATQDPGTFLLQRNSVLEGLVRYPMRSPQVQSPSCDPSGSGPVLHP